MRGVSCHGPSRTWVLFSAFAAAAAAVQVYYPERELVLPKHTAVGDDGNCVARKIGDDGNCVARKIIL